ncbi:hypothetical protein SLEP1_g55747 [Rubroshorea leprosula]|uniref:Leucine-rich repeat-containing N-terminal plant-type domain-containing protein n=1 Tax=Rubroshorea leprosula TaxID=152421 RepID=A0AAV5MHH4_9ROSI|nr:hypothetical protein SLEP1_g55747 [Rubroshorea leprosula]
MRETLCAMLVLVAVLFFGAAEFCSGRNTSFSCIEKEREALLKFKLCFHDPSHMLSSWKGNDCCEWKGVGCDKNNRYVVSLQLKGSVFANQRPQLYLIEDVEEVGSSLLKLRYLEHLDLSNNNFSGNLIPPSFGLMKQLRYLKLSCAQFRGRIPGELGNLTRLRVLDLSQYYYRGLKVDDDIQWISHLSSLQQLDMSGVNLSHASSNLFQVLGMLSSLSWLSLSDCSLKNSHLPSHNHLNFTLLGNIQHLDMSYNSFHGPIPIFLQNMTSLTFLDMSGVNLSLTSSNLFQVLGMLSSLSWLSLLSCSLKNCHLPSYNHPFNFTLLGNIQHLDLSANFFQGPIPIFLQNMTSLILLYLSENQLSGSIPDSIGQLSKLESIDLSFNQLSGSIPDSIEQLSKLERMDLSGNQLRSIPDSIGQLSNMSLSGNQLRSIPDSIGKLSKLESMSLFGNQLRSIPDSIRQLSKLESIDLSSNQFGIGFPKWRQLPKIIKMVGLSNASISGPLPENIGHMMPMLESLYLENNLMNGSIPKSLCNLKYLKTLDLSNNMLSGNIPKSLCNSESLGYLDLSNNMLSGSIPNCWRNDQSFIFIDLSSNNLSGLFPSKMVQLSSLSVLHLNNNSLHKGLHVALKIFASLVVLDLGENKFSGNLTSMVGGEISNHSLKVLRLRKNLVSGYIPLELCSLSQMQILDLADNNLIGRIPPCFGKFPIMVNATQLIYDIVSEYWYEAPLMEVVKGRYLEYKRKTLRLEINIDLSSNNLIGSIPEELTFLKDLHNLNLSWNHLSGKIPEKIGQMENLESLDFSKNGLSGMIPNSMSSLTKLSYLNLSYNNLSGPIPTGYQLQTLEDPTMYVGNPQLCGAPLLNKCSNDTLPPTTANFKDNDESALKRMWFYIVMLLGFATGFWGVVGTLIFVKNWRYAYFQWMDDVQHWILGIITLKVAQFKKMFNGNQDDQ